MKKFEAPKKRKIGFGPGLGRTDSEEDVAGKRDFVRAANEFALPQIQIVEPKIVICLGLATFNALRRACAETQCHPLDPRRPDAHAPHR